MTTPRAEVTERTITYGCSRYRVDAAGHWWVEMWGWWPLGGDRPAYRWMPIPIDKIPDAVVKAAAQEGA